MEIHAEEGHDLFFVLLFIIKSGSLILRENWTKAILIVMGFFRLSPLASYVTNDETRLVKRLREDYSSKSEIYRA